MTPTIDADATLRRARALLTAGGRRLVGIAGPPAAGKSTLAAWLAASLGERCALVPMDGYHLADVELDRLGLRDRKGAPETFDGWGYLALLDRLTRQEEPIVYAPGFARDLEQPIAGAVPVPVDARLVLTEGNYLLLHEEPWTRVRAALSEVWYCELPDGVRMARLVARHREFGKSAREADEWIARVDVPNAALVERSRERADAIVAVT